jgi:hypothetical protein
VDAEGLLQLREDVYGLDKIGADKVAKINARLKQ